jgi:uncharacterized protein YeaO (DUF488 family)
VDVRIKRVYDEVSPDDGYRVLIDRLWPRGVSKDRAELDLWLKDAAPSPELRTEWHAHPERWDEFADGYRAELADNPAVEELRSLAAKHSRVTLLYGAHDPERNHAVILLAAVAGSGAGAGAGS